MSDSHFEAVLRGTQEERDRLRAENAALRAVLEQIAELDGDCEHQRFRLTRFQASQIARKALHEEKGRTA